VIQLSRFIVSITPGIAEEFTNLAVIIIVPIVSNKKKDAVSVLLIYFR